jgi:glucose-6-phosphate 1-epimerase
MLAPTDFHGLPALLLRADDGARATIALQGAHVVSWIPAGGTETIYVSPRSVFRAGEPIRGGVPLVFPQFANYGPLAQHGFARTQLWRLAAERAGGVSLRLDSGAQTRALWPHEFAAELAVDIGGERLDLALRVANTDAREFSFTAALHTYLGVSDIAAIRLDGLAGCAFFDRANNDAPGRETAASMTVTQEIDRVYTDVCAPLRLTDKARTLDISQTGFRDCVIWNPGPRRSAAMADMPPDAYRHMFAVEAATVARPVTLAPGATWDGSQTLRARA